jgi:phospholipase D1/2
MPWAPLVVIAIYTPSAFLMFPRPLLTLLTVIAFGPWLGFVYGMIGILLSSLATYYVGVLLPPHWVERLAGRNLEPVKQSLRRHGVLAVTAMRLVPAAPFAIEGMIAGGLRVKMWHFEVGTFLGMLPGVLATTVFGDQIAAWLEDPEKLSWWVVAGVVLFIAATAYLARRLVKR